MYFCLYCRENIEEVRRLRDDLVAAGETVWWDQDLGAGEWDEQVRKAMDESYAIVLRFSKEMAARETSEVYPEIDHAIELCRKHPPGAPFLFPVRLSDCTIPSMKIGATRRLELLQRADLFPKSKRRQGLEWLRQNIRAARPEPVPEAENPMSDAGGSDRELPETLEREQFAVHLKPGDRLLGKRFKVIELLGFGGMGAVYKVHDCEKDSECAVKLMLPSLVGSETALKRFRREVCIAHSLLHECIVRVHELMEDEARGVRFFTMELIEGRTLRALLDGRGGRLPLTDAVEPTDQLLDALAYAHHRGVVHRDLTPQNIMVQPDGRIKVLDFGLARVMSQGRFTTTGAALGVADYAAPEVRRASSQIDRRADIYSVGAMLYEMLTGRLPLGLFKRPSVLVDRLPPALDEVVFTCLQYEPEERYATIQKLGEALTASLAHPLSCSPARRQLDQELQRTKSMAHQDAPYTREAVSAPGARRSVEVAEGVWLEVVWIPPGTFLMGSPADERGRYDDETQHEVTFPHGIWMGMFQVTQAQWTALMEDNPAHFKGDRPPVDSVSWYDCQLFLAKLNTKGTGTFRLPTEAEWEYACRAGFVGAYCFGTDIESLPSYAWFGKNSELRTHAVGERKPNAWGLCDLHGNVWEWCMDWYGAYEPGRMLDPAGPSAGRRRVSRGGSWISASENCRAASRFSVLPPFRAHDLGFRVVLDG